MQTIKDVHYQFAAYFSKAYFQPYAYLVSKKLSEGHICLNLDKLEEEKLDLYEGWQWALDNPDKLQNEALVTTDPAIRQPFVLFNNRLYLQRYFSYETIILRRILAFLQTETDLYEKRVAGLDEHAANIRALFLEDDAVANRTNWQLAAAVSAVLQNFTIITGGPGTGKTTTVAKILALLFSLNSSLKVALAAPTGKAAARMAESLKSAHFEGSEDIKHRFHNLDPSTIHRLLGYIPDSPFFKHHHNNPLNFDIVIVDESSMIDVALFAKLLDAIGPDTRLILLGDKNQLASVEAGSLFGDLCLAQEKLNIFKSGHAALINSFIPETALQISLDNQSDFLKHPLAGHVIELMYSRRFSDKQGIGRFSKAIISNETAVVEDLIGNKIDMEVDIDTHYSDFLFEGFVSGYEGYIREGDIRSALRKFNSLRVLCATREGIYGLNAVNSRIEKFLESRNLLKADKEFYENRPIMITSNNYSLGLFNGDVGIIRPDKNGVLYAWFEDREGEIKAYSPAFISQCETVFAMTIHKSQGSEFNKVLVALSDDVNNVLLTRELLYTAVTRARKYVLVQGTEEAIVKSCARFVDRASGIVERLKQVVQ